MLVAPRTPAAAGVASRAGLSPPVRQSAAEESAANSAPFAAARRRDALSSLSAEFRHIDTWVFDLDNTLYPAGSDLWPKIDQRITLYLIRLFGLDGISSRALQKYYYQHYGTTLRGLVADHEVSAEDYLAFVHDIDRSSLVPDISLAAAIEALPGRKLILTNGSREHALRTAEALGLARLFEDIFDIVAADFIPKPESAAYQRFFEKHGVDPKTSAIFEDLAQNLVVPHEAGMRTTLVMPAPGQSDYREAFEIVQDTRLLHIDYTTSDLANFLLEIGGSRPAAATPSGYSGGHGA